MQKRRLATSVSNDPLVVVLGAKTLDLLARYRLPAIMFARDEVEIGACRPSDEATNQFEFIINPKTAKGARADDPADAVAASRSGDPDAQNRPVTWRPVIGRSAQSLGGVPRTFMALRPWTSGEIEYLKGGA
jgi:hypothetical protein